jgi:hypothetical protein
MEGSHIFEPGQEVFAEGFGTGKISEIHADGVEETVYTIAPDDGGEPWRGVPEAAIKAVAEEPREGEQETKIAEPPSVFEELGRNFAEVTEDRREIFPILPGRFHGNLSMRARPVDPTKRKKKVRRIAKTGITDEAEARYAAEIIAEACDTILVRLKDGEDPIPAHEIPNSGLGDEPVRFDQRLGKVVPSLGEILTGSESPAAIVRLLFKGNLDALDGFYVELDQWLKEASPTEADDEDGDESAERPT